MPLALDGYIPYIPTELQNPNPVSYCEIQDEPCRLKVSSQKRRGGIHTNLPKLEMQT